MIDYALTLPGTELFPRIFKARSNGKMTSQDANKLVDIWLKAKTVKENRPDLEAYANANLEDIARQIQLI